MGIPQLLVSVLLFMILFLGIGFILNMLLRKTWVMAFLYPIVVIMIVDKIHFFEYFTKPTASFASLSSSFSTLGGADVIILTSGFMGAILSGIIIRYLRKNGYQMF